MCIIKKPSSSKKKISVKDLFNSLSPETQDVVKFALAEMLVKINYCEDNSEDIALSILTSSNKSIY